MTDITRIPSFAASVVPFVLLALLSMKVNLKKINRSRQFLMPVLALVMCIAAMVFISDLYNTARAAVQWALSLLGSAAPFVSGLLNRIGLSYLAFFTANFLMLLAYVIVKRIVITILSKIFRTGNGLYESVVSHFYNRDEKDDNWYVREELSQVRGLLRALFYATLAVCCALMVFSASMYSGEAGATAIFYPVFAVILVGELYFFLDGLTKHEVHLKHTVEEDEAVKQINYSLMRQVLRKIFPDKLSAEDTKANESDAAEPIAQLLDRICADEDPAIENYGRFMQGLYRNRQTIDRNYLFSGLDLLKGRSILFNNPFYWDYIPYIFYPINRVLLRNKKVLVILGRNGTQEDIKAWAEAGLVAVNSTPELWSVQVLTGDMEKLPDVGILTRSSVHDQKLHEQCAPFFAQVELAVIIEPSRLLTTAQIGLNSVAKRVIKPDGSNAVWCGIDKNCDGLVDALSHALLTNIIEVSATEKYSGVSSYMLWDADGEHMQHRLLPNISRFLGFGTELSFAALKNQIDAACWYGGETFPVTDMHWIAKQYYFDLLSYAELPAVQQTVDEKFVTSHNLWNAPVAKNAYLTVEDEDRNMFEMRRVFSTRAQNQGFVNILSEEYLLKDYMAENADIFEADAKAIPHIVADYERSERNVILRLALMMSSGAVREDELRKELALIGVDRDDTTAAYWELLCRSISPVGAPAASELMLSDARGMEHTFDAGVIRARQKYDIDAGRVVTLYYIDDAVFIRCLVSELQNADCITEDEKGQVHYLGSELRGHIFQKYLPGQFFTLEGKYYEMLSVTPKGQMLMRRAADHISGRTCYRQEREYHISAMEVSDRMGAVRDIAGMKVTRAYADLTVETPAYWQMDRYSDFAHAKHVKINAIPTRTYHNKQILRIEMPKQGLTSEILYTVTVLFNEVFRTLFAGNQPYIAAVMAGKEMPERGYPLTYRLTGDVELGENTIYLIEDSQLDLGLLVSAERCLGRIFEMVCDYLDWHTEAVSKSIDPPPPPTVPDYRIHPIPEDGNIPQDGKKSKNPFKVMARLLKRLWRAIAGFFGKLFRRKPKEEPDAPETADTPQSQEPEPEDTGGQSAETDPPQESDSENTPGESDVDSETPGGQSQSRISFSTGAVHYDSEPVEPAAGMTVEYEDAAAVKANAIPSRKPYHERYFLLFGEQELLPDVVPQRTLEYLVGLGYGNSSLKQARQDQNLAELIARGLTGSGSGHLCDFCGRPLSAMEYEVLSDGRERCSVCSHSAVRSAEEFENILDAALKNLNSFFGVEITAPVHIQMVNSKKLHRKLGKTFVPTGNADGRVLGVAIRSKDGYSILIENGAPRIQSTMTLVHELTHIWQYLNWDQNAILYQYGKEQELEVYEGMAKWTEIQYAYLIGESGAARREEINTRMRNDEYGKGFLKYVTRYPIKKDFQALRHTPFEDRQQPL